MGKLKKSQSEFNLEGRFLGYVVEDGYKIKQLRLATADGECFIKLSKEARANLGRVLVPGDWIKVEGTQKADSETESVRLKAYSVVPIVPLTSIEPDIRPNQTKASILVCQKSGCMKRGGRAVCQALETALSDRGLDDQVTIKGTGCMKNCGQGPNVVMPGKARYCKIDAKEIPALIDKHFPEVELIKLVKMRKLQPIA
jgi:(2Fe-2S) ferredoxin